MTSHIDQLPSKTSVTFKGFIENYAGNKSKEIDIIKLFMHNISTEIDTIFDGFCGGGIVGMSLATDYEKKLIVNDINEGNATRYLEFLESSSVVNKRMIEKLPEKTFSIYNVDCLRLVEEFKEDSNVFFYLDPPYMSKKNDDSTYGTSFVLKDMVALIEIMKESECKIMLNINYNGWVQRMCGDMVKYVYPHSYSGRKLETEDYYANYHCIICNYNPFYDTEMADEYLSKKEEKKSTSKKSEPSRGKKKILTKT